MISPENLVACICEGSTEKTIISILLEENALTFTEDQLLDEELLFGKFRDPETFTDHYLTMDYDGTKIVVLSIQDDTRSYNIKSPYSNKIKEVCLIVTKPEIEMLMIHSLNLYNDYQKLKSKKKPSLFLAEHLGEKSSVIKSEAYIRKFYKKHSLVDAIQQHSKKAKRTKNHYFLVDLLK